MKRFNPKATPVIRNLRGLFKESLPQGPVIIHVTEDEWKTLGEGIETSRRRVREDAKGIFVIPSPYGGQLLFLTCAAGSGEGLACIPQYTKGSRGTVTLGPGCFCIRGKDVVEKPIEVEPESCSLGISLTGGFVCTGKCSTGKRCNLVKIPVAGGRAFIACECS